MDSLLLLLFPYQYQRNSIAISKSRTATFIHVVMSIEMIRRTIIAIIASVMLKLPEKCLLVAELDGSGA